MKPIYLLIASCTLLMGAEVFAAQTKSDRPVITTKSGTHVKPAEDTQNALPVPEKLNANEVVDQPDVDAVAEMKMAYQKQFPEMPPSRNCLPQDTKGWWVEQNVWQNPRGDAFVQFNNKIPNYVWFGSYNRFMQKRSAVGMGGNMEKSPAANQQQYIVSAKGVLYVYEGSQLKSAMLCFTVSENTDKYKKGALLLAAPVAQGKPFTVSLYAPLAGGR